MFTINDLKTGMITQYRDGRFCVVLKETVDGDMLVLIKDNGHDPLNNFISFNKRQSPMSISNKIDIIKVYESLPIYKFMTLVSLNQEEIEFYIRQQGCKILYEEKSQEQENLESIVLDLQKQLNETQSKLNNLK